MSVVCFACSFHNFLELSNTTGFLNVGQNNIEGIEARKCWGTNVILLYVSRIRVDCLRLYGDKEVSSSLFMASEPYLTPTVQTPNFSYHKKQNKTTLKNLNISNIWHGFAHFVQWEVFIKVFVSKILPAACRIYQFDPETLKTPAANIFKFIRTKCTGLDLSLWSIPLHNIREEIFSGMNAC